jgi:rare lipoprotein A
MTKKLLLSSLLLFFLYGCGTVSNRYSADSQRDDYFDTKNRELYEEVGDISYYAEDFHGKPTANGEIFDMNKVSAAHPKFPLNTIIKVKNLKNGKEIIIRVNDRMPPNPKGRILDVSKAAAKELDFINDGVVKAKITVLKWGDGKSLMDIDNNLLKPTIRY